MTGKGVEIMNKDASKEILELIKLNEKDLDVITDPVEYDCRQAYIDGLYDALKIVGGETAEEVY